MSLLKTSEIWNRLATRLGVKDFGLEPVHEVVDTVQPVTVVDDLLDDFRVESGNVNLTVASGTLVTLKVVPEGERWTILIGRKDASTGSCGLGVSLRSVGQILTARQAAEVIYNPSMKITLDAGDILGAIAGGNAGDGAINISYALRKEKRR